MTAEVLVVSHDPEVRELAAALHAEGIKAEATGTYAEARRFVEHTPECVAVLDTQLPADVAFQIYELLHDAHPIPTLMLVSEASYQQFTMDTHRPAMDEYMSKPAKVGALVLRAKALMLHAGFDLPSAKPLFPLNGEIRPTPVDDFAGSHNGQILVMFATKGGVGKSMISVNLALGLASQYQQKTLLVDADLWFGDVGVLLNMSTNTSLYEAYDEEGELDQTRLLKVLTPHPSGASLLLRPPDPSMAERLDPAAVLRALVTYRAFFDYIIVDTHSTFNEMNLQILEVADRILLVTTPEISAIHNTARFLAIADALGYTDKISLILNRANSGVQLNALEQQLGMDISATVVSAGRVVVDTSNRGNPLILESELEQEEVTQNLRRIVESVAGKPWPGLGRPAIPKSRGLRGLFPFGAGARG